MESRSAKEPGRPIFNALMQRVYRGEAAGIICWKLDRLARNPVDGGSIIWAIKQHGIKVVTPAQHFSREEDNIILMYIEFGMAQKYVDDLSKNVKRGLKTKIENGWYPGVAPPGYLNHTDKQTGESIVIVDPERFPLIRRMWDMLLTGLYTPPKILEIANKEWGYRTRPTRKLGGSSLCRTSLYEIFNRPFYFGRFEYPQGSGKWYEGRHQPLITEAEFARVQAMLGRRGNTRPIKNRDFPYTGIMKCGECTAMITAAVKNQLVCSECRFKFAYREQDACPQCKTKIDKMTRPIFRRYTYYHCTKRKDPRCSQKSISSIELERQIETYLERIQLSQTFKDWAITYLRELHRSEGKLQKDILQSQQKSYGECLRRLDNLVQLKTSPDNINGSLLSDDEYGRKRTLLLEEKTRFETLFREAGEHPDQCLDLSEQALTFACLVRERFSKGDINIKKEILTTVGWNLVLKDKILNIEARKPFFILETFGSPDKFNSERLEPENHVVKQRREDSFESSRPSRCTGTHDVGNFGPKHRKLVGSILHFFRSLCSSPNFKLQDWKGLTSEPSMTDVKKN